MERAGPPPCLHVLVPFWVLTPALSLSFLSWKMLVIAGSASWVLRRFGAGSLRCSKSWRQRASQMRDHVYRNTLLHLSDEETEAQRGGATLPRTIQLGVSGGTKVHPLHHHGTQLHLGPGAFLFVHPQQGACVHLGPLSEVELLGQCAGLNCDGSACGYFPERLHTSSYGRSCSSCLP